MPRKTVKTINSLIKNSKSLLNTTVTDKPYIPDIITFCYDPAYLGFSALATPINLYPVQELILKCFYRGSEGNEHLVLTPEDIKLCETRGLNNSKNGNIIEKWHSGELFRELVLVWGRRSGKDFTIAIIALYEAMRLLESPGGDPYSRYKLGSASPFTILTIANSQGQARILYNEIREKFIHAPYFRDKFSPDGLTQDSIYMLTPKDKHDNAEFAKKGWPQKLGSIRVVSGHSNSDSLLGLGCYVLLLDEVASFKTTGGSSSGDRIYTALTPTTKTYARREVIMDNYGSPILGPDGEPLTKTVYDGKIISISSPRGMDGVFWNLYTKAEAAKHMLMCRLPTWDVNVHQNEHDLRASEPLMTDERFRMEYGAEFSGTEGENFFPPKNVEKCFANNYKLRDMGEPGKTYFAHLDPAKSSHNYVLAIVHKEPFINQTTKQIDFYIVLDHMRVWSPKEGQPIQLERVDEHMLWVNTRFHLALVTYDQWNSQHSVNRLRRAGIPAMETIFNKNYKIQIYDELYALVTHNEQKLILPPECELLKNEMLNLQRKFMGQGYRIYPKTEGECKTDDCCDALAGACFNALKTDAGRLPQGALVNTGVVPSSNHMLWRSMQGTPYGYGSGQQVSHQLERRGAYKFRPWG
jgi:hypothetical protein